MTVACGFERCQNLEKLAAESVKKLQSRFSHTSFNFIFSLFFQVATPTPRTLLRHVDSRVLIGTYEREVVESCRR